MAGSVPIDVFGSNDAGTVLVGTAGSFMTGTYGAIWVQDLGWMLMSEFLHRQGVVEAQDLPIDNPTAISGVGDTIIGGLAGVQFSWLIDLREVYVCEAGQSVATTARRPAEQAPGRGGVRALRVQRLTRWPPSPGGGPDSGRRAGFPRAVLICAGISTARGCARFRGWPRAPRAAPRPVLPRCRRR